jgi:hypothetical protein
MRKLLLVLAAALAAVAATLSAAPASAAPYCGITWGSLAKAAGPYSTTPLTNIRTGQQPCYDRLVVDLAGPAAGYDVRYVANVYEEGSGRLVPLAGGAKLQIIVKAPAYDANGRPTYAGRSGQPLPGVNLRGYRTFRDAKFAGSFEGQTTVGLGVRARLPFRVFTLAGPGAGSRLVIDVAHRW